MKIKRETRSTTVFIQHINYSQYDMTEFKKNLYDDLDNALNSIFSPPLLNLLNRHKEELFSIDKEEGILTYLIKDEEDEYISLIHLIFSKVNMTLKKIELNQEHYYSEWRKNKWTLINEIKGEWFYDFFDF